MKIDYKKYYLNLFLDNYFISIQKGEREFYVQLKSGSVASTYFGLENDCQKNLRNLSKLEMVVYKNDIILIEKEIKECEAE